MEKCQNVGTKSAFTLILQDKFIVVEQNKHNSNHSCLSVWRKEESLYNDRVYKRVF